MTKTLKERLEAAIKTPSVLVIVKYAIINMFKIKKDELVQIDNSNIKGDVVYQSDEINKSQNNMEQSDKHITNQATKKVVSQRLKKK